MTKTKKTAPVATPRNVRVVVHDVAPVSKPSSLLCPDSAWDLVGRLLVMRNRVIAVAAGLDAIGFGDLTHGASDEACKGFAEILEGVQQELELFETDYSNEVNALEADLKAARA